MYMAVRKRLGLGLLLIELLEFYAVVSKFRIMQQDFSPVTLFLCVITLLVIWGGHTR
jgi:hypothetical protein